MKKIKVNKEACIGCGACVAIDKDHFDFDDNGLSEVISNENIDTTSVTNAIEACPTGAIVITEDTEECHCENCECEDCHCDEECTCTECHCECDQN